MLLVLDAAGLALLVLFALAIVADIRNWWPCQTCGRSVDHPLHYVCRAHASRCRQPHHPYAKAAWPFVVLAVAMGAVAVGFVVLT
jgi:hypothetical protein